MHPSVQDFVERVLTHHRVAGRSVLEVGSYDVNGSVRPYVETLKPACYLGVDAQEGPRVDTVVDCEHLTHYVGCASWDVVITTEMLEHVRNWRSCMVELVRAVKLGGLLLITTRGPGFPFHPFPEDHWRYTHEQMRAILDALGMETLFLEDDSEPGVLVLARRALDVASPVLRARLAQIEVDPVDVPPPSHQELERPKGSTRYPLIALSDENIAVAEAMGVNPAIHENDFIFQFVDCLWAAEGGRERAVKEYFNLGRHSADLIKTMIADVQKVYQVAEWDWAPRRVLDFASGYGCTARHLRQVFPDSLSATCDIHLDAVNFTKDGLGVESYLSSPVPEQLKLPPQDVIFAHSFFSHMPESTWARWLQALANALAPGGVLIFTTHGFAFDKLGYPGLTVKANGFGFIAQSEQDDPDTAQYGLTISYPRWVLAVLALMPELRLSKFHEGLWWGTHGTQDTYVCVKEGSMTQLSGGPVSDPNHPTTPVSVASESMPRMSPAAAEEYIASLYATILKRDPKPDEFAHWVTMAATFPPEQVYFAFANSKEYASVNSKESKEKNELYARGLAWGKASYRDGGAAAPARERKPNPLETYFDGHVEGQGIWKWRHYLDAYHRHFAKFVGTEVHVLEIGVYSGGSLQMWKDYFGPACRVYGVDIQEECKVYEQESIRILIGNQGDPEFWEAVCEQVPKLDIVIDDGSHDLQHQITTLEALLPHLRQGGVFMVEDLYHPNNGFHDYAAGLSRNIHAWGQLKPGVHDHHDGLIPEAFQRSVGSMHVYPYLTVFEKHDDPPRELSAPRMGNRWQPWYGHQ